MNKIWIYIKSILMPVAVGAIVGFITSKFIDYETLVKPPLAPPGAAFPIVWTILYILMGVSYGILKSNKQTDSQIDFIYYLQLGVNALWSIFFFVFKWRLFSVAWIVLLALLILSMIKQFLKKNKVAGLLQLPYIAWVLFATYLTIGVYILN